MDRQERYFKRVSEQGFKRITVMVHEEDALEVRAFAEKLRKARRQELEPEPEPEQETEDWM